MLVKKRPQRQIKGGGKDEEVARVMYAGNALLGGVCVCVCVVKHHDKSALEVASLLLRSAVLRGYAAREGSVCISIYMSCLNMLCRRSNARAMQCTA